QRPLPLLQIGPVTHARVDLLRRSLGVDLLATDNAMAQNFLLSLLVRRPVQGEEDGRDDPADTGQAVLCALVRWWAGVAAEKRDYDVDGDTGHGPGDHEDDRSPQPSALRLGMGLRVLGWHHELVRA